MKDYVKDDNVRIVDVPFAYFRAMRPWN